jgi:hypothetical protein
MGGAINRNGGSNEPAFAPREQLPGAYLEIEFTTIGYNAKGRISRPFA